MNTESRLRALEHRVGLDGSPMIECPSCGGEGTHYDVDGPWRAWQLQNQMNEIAAQFDVQPPFELADRPQEDPQICVGCRGAGRVAADQLARRPTGKPPGWLEAQLMLLARRTTPARAEPGVQ